jgi:transcriptional regulator with XRE-family HTH domain
MNQVNPEQPGAPEAATMAIDGAKVRRARKLRGCTLKDFADTCGISLTYLSQIERGDRPRVSPKVFVGICDALGLDQENREELLKIAEVPV